MMGLIIGRNFSRYIASLPPAEPEPTLANIMPTVANLAQVEQLADTTKITPVKATKGARSGKGKSSKKQGGLASRPDGTTQLCGGQPSTQSSTEQSQNVSTDANVDTTQSSSVGSEVRRSTRII